MRGTARRRVHDERRNLQKPTERKSGMHGEQNTKKGMAGMREGLGGPHSPKTKTVQEDDKGKKGERSF